MIILGLLPLPFVIFLKNRYYLLDAVGNSYHQFHRNTTFDNSYNTWKNFGLDSYIEFGYQSEMIGFI